MKIHRGWIVGLVIIALVGIGVFVAEMYLKKRIKQELQIQTASGDTLQISRVDLGLLGGWIDINDLSIRWNIPGADSTKEKLTYLIKGNIGKVQLKGLSYSKYLFQNTIHVNELLIDSSDLDFHLLKITNAEDAPSSDYFSGSNTLAISISGIKLAPSSIRYFKGENQGPEFEVGELGLELEGFRYPKDTASQHFIRHFKWSAKDLRYSQAAQFSDLIVAECSGSSADSTFTFAGFRFLPRYSKAEYSRHLKHQDSRVDVVVSKGRMEGLDWLKLATAGRINIRNFVLDTCRIEVYEDSRLPVDESRYKSLYAEKLLGADIGISVDSVEVRNGHLLYEMRPKLPEANIGYLKFLNLNATITNITNDSQRIARDPLLRTKVNTVVNGESELQAYFTFDLSSPDFAFNYTGDMHQFDLPQFNTILMETSRMKIVAGKMQRLAFEVAADNRLATGEMKIEYDGLKIEWQEQHNALAALAQKVIMREQNPKNGSYRIGKIYFERQPYRSFWNFYLKSLLSGLTSTALPNLFLPEELDARKEKK